MSVEVPGFICQTLSLCLHISSGRVRGLRGSFSIKHLIRFSLSQELLTDFKGVGGNLTEIYFQASILSSAGLACNAKKHTHIQKFCSCSNF